LKSTSAANLLKSRSQSAGFPSLISGYYDYNEDQNYPTTRYYYDGQMMVEDDYTVEGQYEPVVTVMRYGIGARGIDFLAKSVDGGAETKGFPLYDGHGNMIATLSRGASTPYFSVGDLRTYDVWGSVRSGSTTGDPKQRYCANLGHIQDDESGLIYMRARYYEPWTGRFVSEDSGHAGNNWFTYAANDPVTAVERSGHSPESETLMFYGALFKLVGVFLMTGGLVWEFACFPSAVMQIVEASGEYNAVMELMRVFDQGKKTSKYAAFKDQIRFLKDSFLYKRNFNATRGTVAGALLALLGYSLVCRGELIQQEAEGY